MNLFKKNSTDTLDYRFDWTNSIDVDETIQSASIFINPSNGLTAGDPIIEGKVAIVWLSGGVIDKRFKVSCTITTDSGRVETRSLYLDCVYT